MEVRIKRLDDFGRGVTDIDGKVCFVLDALPGELVKIEIIKENRKYIEAIVLKIIEKNFNRKESDCPYFHICGGCCFWHYDFATENEYKEEKVRRLVTKFSKINSEIVRNICFHEEKSYRNKITLHGKNGQLGLYRKGTNEIIAIEKCLLVCDKINMIIRELHRINDDIREVVIKTSNDEEYSMVKIAGKIKESSSLEDIADVVILNGKLLTTKENILTAIGSKKYYQSINSFFQINKTLTRDLYDEALTIVEMVRPRRVLDLYCGTGTIGIYVSDYCEEIIGVDYNESNIADANKNKELNGLTSIKFLCDKVENIIEEFVDIDMVIVDPPRAGLDEVTRRNLLRIGARNIIYISCDPVTLVRDLNEFSDKYEVRKIVPYNMFPRTYHVECVALLYLR